MRRNFQNQRGSVLMIALLIFLILSGMLVAASPTIINELKMNTVNRDMVEAQYAAEAGAKIGMAAVYGKKTDWSWLGKPYYLVNGDTAKTYSVTITPTLSAAPTAGTEYTITSTGVVNNSTKKVIVKVTAGGSSSVLKYASYSGGPMNIISGTVTGDIAATSSLTIGFGMTVDGAATITKGVLTASQLADVESRTTGTVTEVTTIGTLDVSTLMKYASAAPAMPTMPSLSSVHSYGRALSGPSNPAETINLTGSYNYASNPTSGVYYYDSNLADWWAKTYNIASGQKVFIYIKGDYTVGMPITGAGDITIFATGTIDVHKNISGSNITLYAGKNLILENTSTIAASGSVNCYSNGTTTVQSNITAASVGVYSQKTITLSGNTIRGDSIVLQSTGDFYVSGGNVLANSGGTIQISTCGNLDMGAGSITGSVVTMVASTASASNNNASGLHGVNINVGQPTYKTYLYVNGNVNMASGTIGGASMIVSMGSVNLHGTTSSAAIIANGDIDAASGSSGGLYANGTINIHGANVSYSSTTFSTLSVSTAGVAFAVGSWSKP